MQAAAKHLKLVGPHTHEMILPTVVTSMPQFGCSLAHLLTFTEVMQQHSQVVQESRDH